MNLLDVSSMLLLLALLDAEGNQLGIVGSSLLGIGSLGLLDGQAMALALECDGGDQALDLGGLPLAAATFLLGGNLAADDELADIVLLAQVEELADLAGTLGAETAGHSRVSEPRDGGLAGLHDNEGKGGNIGSDNATTDRLAAALTRATGAVARVANGEEEAGTLVQQNTLLHGETLLIVTTGNLQDVTLPLVTEGISLDFLSHTLIVEDATKSFKIRSTVGKGQ